MSMKNELCIAKKKKKRRRKNLCKMIVAKTFETIIIYLPHFVKFIRCVNCFLKLYLTCLCIFTNESVWNRNIAIFLLPVRFFSSVISVWLKFRLSKWVGQNAWQCAHYTGCTLQYICTQHGTPMFPRTLCNNVYCGNGFSYEWMYIMRKLNFIDMLYVLCNVIIAS